MDRHILIGIAAVLALALIAGYFGGMAPNCIKGVYCVSR